MLTATEFKEQFGLKSDLLTKYKMVYLIVRDLMNIIRCEEILEAKGFTVQRVTNKFLAEGILYSLVYYQGQEVGVIDLQGFPSIYFYKRCRQYAKLLAADPLIIAPIPTIHRILGWHKVTGKLHCLAGGETVCHVLPISVTTAIMEERILTLKLQPLVDHYTQT